MATIHSQKARNDIYNQGLRVPDSGLKQGYRLDRSKPADEHDTVIVKKGEIYFWWQHRNGPKHMSLIRPKQSQVTSSDFLSNIYSIQEQIEDYQPSTAEELKEFRDGLVSDLEEAQSECEERRSNMPEALQDIGSGELLGQRYEDVGTFIDELNAIDLDYDPEGEGDEDSWIQERLEELQQITYQGS